MDGIIDNLRNAIETWNEKLAEIWLLSTQSPEDFKGGGIWKIIEKIHGALLAIGIALLVLFLVVVIVKTRTSHQDIKRPEHILKLFIRFATVRGLIVYGMELMKAISTIIQGIASMIMTTVGVGTATNMTISKEIIDAADDCGLLESIPLWAVTPLGGVSITVSPFVVTLIVYGRFFKIYMYTVIAPTPLLISAGESTQHIAIISTKSYAGVCLKGSTIVLACIIFLVFAASPPMVDPSASAASMVWSYVGELIFDMLILVGMVKTSDRIAREVMGL